MDEVIDKDYKDSNPKDGKKSKKKNLQKVVTGTAITHSARKSADILTNKYVKPDTYTGNRKLFDSAAAKKMVKEKSFAKGNVIDPYTGKKLKPTIKDAKRKYGDKWQEHLAEGDHIVPIEKIYSDSKDSAWLSNNDIKNIANSPENLQTVSRKFNNSKRNRTNEELVGDERYLNKTGLELSDDGKKNAIEIGNKAQKDINIKKTRTKIKNITNEGHKEGKKAATSAALSTAVISSISNMSDVYHGEKDVGEAVADVAVDTGKAAVAGYVLGAAETVILHTLKNSPSKFIQTLSKSNVIGTVVTMAVSTGGTLKQYVNGEISIHEFADAVAAEGVATLGAYIGLVIAGPIGGVVGGMMASAACDLLVSIKQRIMADENEYKINIAIMSKIENEALNEIKYQRKHLEETIKREFDEWDESFESGFQIMLQSVRDNDFLGFSDGIDKIMLVFKSEAMFHSESEVEQFFFDDNLELDF